MESRGKLALKIEEALSEQPVFDVHTHLSPSHLTARGLHDIMLYHMVISDLYSADCPNGARLPDEPSDALAANRIEEAIPYLQTVSNTSCNWGMRIILKDLYNWDKPITKANWRELDAAIRAKAADPAWARNIVKRSKILRSCTESWRRRGPQDDWLFQYSLEWAFFARCQWGEFDTALYELERTASETKPESPLPVTLSKRPEVPMPIKTLKDVHSALDHYVALTPCELLTNTAQHISTDIDYTPVDDATMSAALTRRANAGPKERDIYASYILDAYLTKLEHLDNPIVFQFSTAAEPLPFETQSRIDQRTLFQIAQMVARHPKLKFQCHVSNLAANQSLCTICRELPNLSLAAYWWHNFFPSFIPQVMKERLDMLSTRKQVGFLSDAYCLDWTYAKLCMVKKMLSQALAEKVSIGQYGKDDALAIADAILVGSPRYLLGMKEA